MYQMVFTTKAHSLGRSKQMTLNKQNISVSENLHTIVYACSIENKIIIHVECNGLF